MTYNEWRDELKNNLLSVSESERKRVLDYYAEAYADRREAGFTEREVIEGFGAPYDAAQRILYEEDAGFEPRRPQYYDRRTERNYPSNTERFEAPRSSDYHRDYYQPPVQTAAPQQRPQGAANTSKKSGDYTWVFVLLCIIFAIPIFVVVVTMAGITIGLCAAPFSLFGAGIARVFAGIGLAITDVAAGFAQIGIGLMSVGVGLALIPLCIWLVKLMWQLFKKFFAWVKALFSGKEGV